ncbi:hypothetical protein UlMin_044406 [Ulmus minor]
MEGTELNTPDSFCLDSCVDSNSSKWLTKNLKDMDHSVKQMLELIEEGDNSSTNNVEMRKPELIANVEEFRQMYRLLAERYDLLTKELCKNTLSEDFESVCDKDSPLLTPEVKLGLHKSGHQAVGLDTSPSSRGAGSVFSNKVGNESSSLSSSDSETESFVNNYMGTPLNADSQLLQQKVIELESELSFMKDKIQTKEADLELQKGQVFELQKYIAELETRVSNAYCKGGILVEELEVTRERLEGSNEEITRLKHELLERTSEGQQLQDRLDSERRLISELQERIVRNDTDLSDRDLEVEELKTQLLDAEEQFSKGKAQLQFDILSLLEKQTDLDMRLKEWELWSKESEEKILLLEAQKVEMQRLYAEQEMALQGEIKQLKAEVVERRDHIEALNKDFDRTKLNYDILMTEKDELSAKVDTLEANVSSRDDQILEMEGHLFQLRRKQEELVAESENVQKLVYELELRVEELQKEVDRQRIMISDGAEEKREAIRQLCFSLEHYRTGYQELRQAFVGHKRRAVMAA